MKSIKMALLGGAALAVTAAGAKADDLDALKAQIEALNTRVAAMEAAPSVPAGYQLVAISRGDLHQTPGLEMLQQEKFSLGNRSTVISVMPTADAPAGTVITWSGYVRAAAVYNSNEVNAHRRASYFDGQNWIHDPIGDHSIGDAEVNNTDDDKDVYARGQIRVEAKTDTAVGEVGLDLKFRADANGLGSGDLYAKTAWGYWAMTPEVTWGGGYAGSLGNIGYGYDGACTCYYTDSADLAFDPGDTTQLRLTYASGPFSMAVALEDAGFNNGFGSDNDNSSALYNQKGDELGAAGEIKYTGDTISGEISGVWRQVNGAGVFGGEGEDFVAEENDISLDDLWQIGAGIGFGMGEIASLSIAAAYGHGPYQTTSEGEVSNSYTLNNDYWGVTALASINMTDTVHGELGAGYKHRETDEAKGFYDARGGDLHSGYDKFSGIDYDTWGVLAGIYYTPVSQLSIGLEGEYWNKQFDFERRDFPDDHRVKEYKTDVEVDNWTVDLVSVWRF